MFLFALRQERVLLDFLRLKNRDSSSHKGNNGRLLVVGGSADYSGAPAIAGRSTAAARTAPPQSC